MAQRSIKQKTKPPTGRRDVLITQAMLYRVRDQLKANTKSEIHAVRSEMAEFRSEVAAEFGNVRAEIGGVKAEVNGLKSEIGGLKSEIEGVKSSVEGLKSEVHRLGALIEEQHAENRAVMEGLTSLFHRQDRCEKKIDEFQTVVSLIKR